MSAPEFSRMIDARAVDGRQLDLIASTAECTALAQRFGLVAVDSLAATVVLNRDGANVVAQGRLKAAIVQPCAISGADLPVSIDEPFTVRFVPEAKVVAAELELSADDCDDIAYSGTHFDLGEAVAQSLALAIDPFAAGPEAEATRASGALSTEGNGAFAGLAVLKLK